MSIVYADQTLINTKHKLHVEVFAYIKKTKHGFNWRKLKPALTAEQNVYRLRIITSEGIYYPNNSYLTKNEAINTCNNIIIKIIKNH